MTGSVVNIRYGLVLITGEDAQQYYHAPDRDNPDLALDRFEVGDTVTFRVPTAGWAEDVAITRRASVPESDGFA